MMIGSYLLAWIPMVLIAIANGILRETTYGKILSELKAHQISSLTGIVLFGFYIGVITYLLPLKSTIESLSIGIIWLGLTIAFEFSFGHYIAGHSWTQLLADYNLLQGRLWSLVLMWVTLAPTIFYQLWKFI